MSGRALRLLGAIGVAGLCGCAHAPAVPTIRGVVWQPDAATARPHGVWREIGARELLVQWTDVDGASLTNGEPRADPALIPDWARIATEPWAEGVIVGLASHSNEARTRADLDGLAARSRLAAANPPPVRVTGWYFPAEIDPGWFDAVRLRDLLAPLPRPLWVSAYDAANIGPGPLAALLKRALPPDVGVLFQDGVGGYARSPQVARHYVRVLQRALGRRRVRLIAEAFRPQVGGGFRAASAAELRPQLQAYRGLAVYVFDGPHYLSDEVVHRLAAPTPLAEP